MVFQGLDSARARAAWKPFLERIDGNEQEWKTVEPFFALEVPARHFWDAGYLSSHVPQAIKQDDRPGARQDGYWWAGDGDQVGAFWSAYTSAWLPSSLLQGSGKQRLAEAWCAASRHWPVSLHFNKGLAGATPQVLAASGDTAMNPEVLDAFALAIIAGAETAAYAGWSQPNTRDAEASSSRIRAADRALRAIAGSYMSECDYFLRDWKRASWGHHWVRLDATKRRYDPEGLFIVHHGVGSDRWSSDGFRRVA
jgi:hypothetical protein